MIDALPVAPSPVNSPAEFDTNAFNFLAALATFRNQANSTALEVQNNADITAALALSMALPNYGGTSTTSLAIGTGAKSFVTQAGKSWTVGQVVVASNGGAYMKGTVTGYSGTALGVNVTSVVGSGTFASWTIGLSYTSLGLAPRAPRVDVATVAGTVDLTTAAPDTDDIQFTGNNAMTGFTAKAGRVFRFVVKPGDTPSLVNGAILDTQSGTNIQMYGGDTGELRVVTDNVVEVLKFTRGYLGTFFDPLVNSANLTLTAADYGKHIPGSGPMTITLPVAVAADKGKVISFYASITGGVTIASQSGQAIYVRGENTVTSTVLGVGECLQLINFNGTAWCSLTEYRAATLGTAVPTTSGTYQDIPVPGWVKRITLQLVGVSTSGASPLMLQLGDAGGVENTGYLGGASTSSSGITSSTTNSAGFILEYGGAFVAAAVRYGHVLLTRADGSNTWTMSSVTSLTAINATSQAAGGKQTSAAMTTLRLTTVGGADTLDLGYVVPLFD